MNPEHQKILNEVCISCGDCCRGGLIEGPIFEPSDLARFVEWAEVSDKLEKVLNILNNWMAPQDVRVIRGEIKEEDAFCPCMGIKFGEHRCSIYDARPSMCRNWNCQLLWDLRECLEDPNVPPTSPFYQICLDETPYGLYWFERLKSKAVACTPRAMRKDPVDADQPARFRRRMGSW